MTFRIAVVQPIANPIAEAEKNIGDAVNFIARAKAEGAHFVCFPETYPGPWRMPATFDPTPRIADAAAKYGINAVYGTIEPLSHNEGTAHNLICMAYGDGRPPASYRPEVTRALALRGAELIFMPAGTDKFMGHLAQPDLVARDREPGDCCHHAESVQPRGARSRDGRDSRGNPVREHRRRAFCRGRKP